MLQPDWELPASIIARKAAVIGSFKNATRPRYRFCGTPGNLPCTTCMFSILGTQTEHGQKRSDGDGLRATGANLRNRRCTTTRRRFVQVRHDPAPVQARRCGCSQGGDHHHLGGETQNLIQMKGVFWMVTAATWALALIMPFMAVAKSS